VNWWSYIILIAAVQFFWDTVYTSTMREHKGQQQWIIIQLPPQSGSFTQRRCPSVCLFVCLSPRPSSGRANKGVTMFPPRDKLHHRKIYACDGSLHVAPTNAPCLCSAITQLPQKLCTNITQLHIQTMLNCIVIFTKVARLCWLKHVNPKVVTLIEIAWTNNREESVSVKNTLELSKYSNCLHALPQSLFEFQ